MPKSPFHAIDPKKVDEKCLLEFSTTLDNLQKEIRRCKQDTDILEATIVRHQHVPQHLLEEQVRQKIAELKAAIKQVEKASSPYLASLRIASDQKKRWF